jgi:hypothetical protein
MQQKLTDGWTRGPVKDPTKKEHPCLVPYADRPPEERAKDALFLAVVHATAAALDRQPMPMATSKDQS